MHNKNRLTFLICSLICVWGLYLRMLYVCASSQLRCPRIRDGVCWGLGSEMGCVGSWGRVPGSLWGIGFLGFGSVMAHGGGLSGGKGKFSGKLGRGCGRGMLVSRHDRQQTHMRGSSGTPYPGIKMSCSCILTRIIAPPD